MNNTGGYSDHRIYGLWSTSRSADIVNDIQYQTYTNYDNMPSGRGQMNFEFLNLTLQMQPPHIFQEIGMACISFMTMTSFKNEQKTL